MKTMNKTQLIGYVGEDPKMITCTGGTKMAKFSVATDHAVKDASGEKQYVVTWHYIVAFDKAAEIALQHFSKGSHIMLEGHLVYRTYPDAKGHTRYVTEIKARTLMNLDR